MIGYKDIRTEYKKLYHGDKDTGFAVVPSETKGMWRIRWPDGILSADHYNYARAREHMAGLYLETQNNGSESLTDAFK